MVPPAPPVASGSSGIGSPRVPAVAPVAQVPIATRVSPLPATGAVEQVSPQQGQQLAMIADGLDGQDYFQILQVPQSAAAGEIKRSFYRDSRVYHPDRIFHLADGKVKDDIGAIYRRITEAYYVLRDDAKRNKYLVDINGPDRATKLRYTEASEAELKAEAKKVVEEEFGTTPKGRQFFKTALQEIDRQQWSAAERNLKSALMYESSNARFKEKLAQVQVKLEDQRKLSGDSFKIK
jgi:DnaJ-class molecular chaperone